MTPSPQSHQVLPLVERQHALIEELRVRAPKPTTARRLAEHLGVSTRTVERDLAVLRDAGLPLVADAGPGGGYRIETASVLPAMRFSAGEASVLLAALVAVGPRSSATAQSALGKILQALHGERAG